MPDSLTNNLSELPVWARIVAVLGFPTVVAALLLGALLGWIKSPMSDLIVLQEKQLILLQQHIEFGSRRAVLDSQQTEYQNMLLRTLCRALVAKGETQQCEPRYRGYEEK